MINIPSIILDPSMQKQELAVFLTKILKESGFSVVETDFEKPWGGYLRIASEEADRFIARYFNGTTLPESVSNATLSPKFLMVEPEKLLSWQVHERRSEFWRVLVGPVGAYLSSTDVQPEIYGQYNTGQTINIPVQTRHRLAGMGERGLVAEIWIHTDPHNPSNESDIRRIADDFGRE